MTSQLRANVLFNEELNFGLEGKSRKACPLYRDYRKLDHMQCNECYDQNP